MNTFRKTLVAFLRAEDGPTAVEYSVMLALIIRCLHQRGHGRGKQCQYHLHIGCQRRGLVMD